MRSGELSKDRASRQSLERETIAVFTPVVRTFMLLVALYYAVVTVNHFTSETGWELIYMVTLSMFSCVAAALYYRDLKDETSLVKLEIAGVVGNGLLLINLLFFYVTQYDSNRLVYFILLMFVFPTTGATLRVSVVFSALSIVSMCLVILSYEPAILQNYIYISIASCFVAGGGSLMLRRVVTDALNAKLDAAEQRSEAERAASQATQLAITDNLTGLPNRRDFFQTLETRAETYAASDHKLVVLLLDLDGFKPVNDTYGHATGDSLLIAVGERLQAAVPENTYIARIGGDEFAAIAAVETPDEAKQIGQALCDCMRPPFNLGRVVVHVGGTVGIAIKDDPSTQPTNLVEYADYALYNAKRAAKGTFALFTASDATNMTRLFFVDQALRRCDLEQELTVAYQPQFDMVAGRISGFEALARWDSRELGKVNPDTFISVAETSGQITKVTQVLLKKAMATLVQWPDDVSISFNLSVHDVVDISAIDNILEITRKTGVEPSRICFEITETVMMGDIKKASAALQRLVDAGHEVALDDFGTGYSNFTYLHKLPLHKIKIDRSFIRDFSENNQSVKTIATLLQLSRSLKKECIVEGVETEAEFIAMKSLGARTVQGYYSGKPMSAEDAHAVLLEREDQADIVEVV